VHKLVAIYKQHSLFLALPSFAASHSQSCTCTFTNSLILSTRVLKDKPLMMITQWSLQCQ